MTSTATLLATKPLEHEAHASVARGILLGLATSLLGFWLPAGIAAYTALHR